MRKPLAARRSDLFVFVLQRLVDHDFQFQLATLILIVLDVQRRNRGEHHETCYQPSSKVSKIPCNSEGYVGAPILLAHCGPRLQMLIIVTERRRKAHVRRLRLMVGQ
jgi:hypothetical protein